MASWETVNNEIRAHAESKPAQNPYDAVRKQKLSAISSISGRPTLIYAAETSNNQKIVAAQGDTAINTSDKDGFAEVLRGIPGDKIDIILHSPGGSPEATEAIVQLLRSQFLDVRFVIPSYAKSAATMLAMSGNVIVIGKNAELGPTDPQMIINGKASPAFAILQQFELAKKEISRHSPYISAWLPILQQYGPSLLIQCKDAIQLSRRLVTGWLKSYMLKGATRAAIKASSISSYLANKKHLSHSRSLDLHTLKNMGVKIEYIEDMPGDYADALESVYHAITITFMATGVYKIFESSSGKGMYRILQFVGPISGPTGGSIQL